MNVPVEICSCVVVGFQVSIVSFTEEARRPNSLLTIFTVNNKPLHSDSLVCYSVQLAH